MTLRFLPAIALSLFTLAAAPAHACDLIPEDGGPASAGFAALEPGTFSGHVNCGNSRHAVAVWTLAVNAAEPVLGIRDEPLFRAVPANPLMRLTGIGYDRDVRFTLFRRTADRGPLPAHLFATVCAGGVDPLNCSLGERRVKIRTEMRDANMDGALDRAYHQISIYDGATRLQVIYVDLPAPSSPQELVGQWIRFFGDTGAVDLDRV